jgi:ABC-type ATPase involved in cell division
VVCRRVNRLEDFEYLVSSNASLFARAIVKEPLLLLADEPTSQLDTETVRSVMRLIKDVADSGTTAVVATHDETARDWTS